LTSIAVTARLDGTFRTAVFPRDPANMETMPQDHPSHLDALRYADALAARTGWLVVDRVGVG
jgi:hypothetical protein